MLIHLRAGMLVLVLVTIAGCDSLQTRSDYDPNVSFAGYRTFSWVSEKPLLTAPPGSSPLAEERIKRAITQSLTGKGYRYVDDRETADFVMAFTLGARDRIRVDTNTYPVGFSGPYRWGVAYYQEVDVREYTEGQLAIDVFDVGLKRPVWHGFASKSLTGQDQKNREATINAAVAKILEDFPPDVPR